MGPYSGGKSTMINYLLGIEFTKSAFKTGSQDEIRAGPMISKMVPR